MTGAVSARRFMAVHPRYRSRPPGNKTTDGEDLVQRERQAAPHREVLADTSRAVCRIPDIRVGTPSRCASALRSCSSGLRAITAAGMRHPVTVVPNRATTVAAGRHRVTPRRAITAAGMPLPLIVLRNRAITVAVAGKGPVTPRRVIAQRLPVVVDGPLHQGAEVARRQVAAARAVVGTIARKQILPLGLHSILPESAGLILGLGKKLT